MTITIYPEIVRTQDLAQMEGYGSEVDETCEDLHNALKGFMAANPKKATAALATQNSTQRFKIGKRYKELYDKDLSSVIKKKFSGDYGKCMELLSLPSNESEAAMLKTAMDGIGASLPVIYSICCGRDNDELNLLKKTYYDMYNKDLSKRLASELHGNMERLVFNCLQGGEEPYDPGYHTRELAEEDAREIYEKGQGRWFTDQKGIFKVLCKSPSKHLMAVNTIYAEKYGYSLKKAFEKELSSNLSDAACFCLGMKTQPYSTIASLIKTACAGIGTNELLLTCCVIRYQDVMAEVMGAHIELFGKTVHERVRSECSGKYKDALLAVLNTAWPEEG